MAMNSREKLLAAGVGLVGTLFVGSSIVSTVLSGLEQKKELIASLEKKKLDQELELTAGDVARLKLNKLVTKSLPRSEEIATADKSLLKFEIIDSSQEKESKIRGKLMSPEEMKVRRLM